jgi:hypothetical protein
MGKRDNLKSPLVQYIIGLAVNIVFVVILLSMDVSYRNLQLPEGIYQDNIQKDGDTSGYVHRARNYLSNGVFGEGNVPDYIRTVGYPFYLAMLMKLFGNNWLVATFFVQAFLYAGIYPVLFKIANILFPDRPSLAAPIFCFYLVSGAYFAQVPALLTDTFFTILFTAGLYFGFLSIIRQSWKYLILQLAFIGYAAQVRPSLIYYPFINVFVLWLIAQRYNVLSGTKIKGIIITSSAVLLLLCNIPSVRNYIHYGFFKPSNVFEYNIFHYLTKGVMTSQNEAGAFEEMAQKVKEANNVREEMSLETEFTIKACTRYPGATVKVLVKQAQAILLHNAWIDMGRYWGYYWRDITPTTNPLIHLKKSEFLYIATVAWVVVYMIMYIFFILFLVRLARKKEWLFLFTILAFVSYLLLPTFAADGGYRMRLPVEGIIVICAFYEISQIKYLDILKTGLKMVS